MRLPVFRRWFFSRRLAHGIMVSCLRIGFYAGYHAAMTGQVDIDAAIAASEASETAKRAAGHLLH